jgi:hypothetical protein
LFARSISQADQKTGTTARFPKHKKEFHLPAKNSQILTGSCTLHFLQVKKESNSI